MVCVSSCMQLVLLFIALSAVGWAVFVAGFGEYVKL